MGTRKFGNTEMETTTIGFGSWAVGGRGWAAGWGPRDDEELVGAIRRSLEIGVNWIDTAAVYGLGHSGEVVLPEPHSREAQVSRRRRAGDSHSECPSPEKSVPEPREAVERAWK